MSPGRTTVPMVSCCCCFLISASIVFHYHHYRALTYSILFFAIQVCGIPKPPSLWMITPLPLFPSLVTGNIKQCNLYQSLIRMYNILYICVDCIGVMFLLIEYYLKFNFCLSHLLVLLLSVDIKIHKKNYKLKNRVIYFSLWL